MKKHRASSFRLYLALVLVMGIAPLSLGPEQIRDRRRLGGTLDPEPRRRKRIVVHISAEQDGSLSGTIDYPDQETSGIQITAITYKEHTLHFESSSIPLFMTAPWTRSIPDHRHLEARRGAAESHP